MKRTLADAAAVTGGELIGGDGAFGVVSTDTRNLHAGALFVALKGPNFDGADFVAAAAERGAAGALVERRADAMLPQIVVPDALRALQTLGRTWREGFSLPIVAVAGSNGKTTAKGMTEAILAQLGACMATPGNLNNHIGVPVTLLRLDAALQSAVIELGANRVGDVAELMALVQPTVGLITNAGAEHLEGFGDLDGVAKGEGETVSCLKATATAVINADDAYADYWRGVSGTQRVATFGVRAKADFMARDVLQNIENGGFVTRFTLVSPAGERAVIMHVGGAHNIGNALAAAAAASAAGASLEHIAAGLAAFRAVAGRLQLKAGLGGSWIIDDSYNANPSSVRAGLDVLGALPAEKWLILGEMAELGDFRDSSHRDIGTYARERGVRRLLAVGDPSRLAVEAFGAGGEWFADVAALTQRALADLKQGVAVLIKGSRVNKLERVVQAVVENGAGG
jgi:UDP-N-acetylmuramoyl-tripeptide--D-alanyl-D-alanine ligase